MKMRTGRPGPCSAEQVKRHCVDVLFPVLVAARAKVDAIKAAKASAKKEECHVVMS
jgi:hypothetical protein